jgi:plastocyanin
MKKGVVIAIIVALLVISGGVFALTRKDKDSDKNTNNTTSSTSSDTSSATNDTTTDSDTDDSSTSQTATITYGNNGFSPSSTTIAAGGTLTIKNTSSHVIQFASDPHPSHTNNPELNTSEIAAGDSKTITVNNKGTWGYHNHDNPNETGTLIIQ